MTGDFEKEFAVAAEVDEFLLARTAKRDAIEIKRTGVIRKFLLAVVPLFADESDGFELPDAAFGNMDLWQEGPDGRHR